MKLTRRNLIWLIPLGLIVTFPLWRLPLATFLEPRGGFDHDFANRDDRAHNFTMEQVVILQNQAGVKTAEIRAEEAQTSDVPHEFILIDVDADLFDEQGNRINIVARTGVYNDLNRQLTLRDDVRIDQVAENQQLYSEELYYFDQDRTIKSPGRTRLVGEQAEIIGSSLDYDILTGHYLIGGRVYCTIAGLESP
jgi:LPS export ABC transporter protein LptC